MVVKYEEENPNLSYVRVNQNTSPGTAGSIKGYITNGLTASDPEVTNASILHRDLLGQVTPPPVIDTPFWSVGTNGHDKATEQESKSAPKEVDNVASNGTPLQEPAATPRNVLAATPSQDSMVTQQVSVATPPLATTSAVAAVASVAPLTTCVTVISVSAGNTRIKEPAVVQLPQQPTRISISTGIKRPREDTDSANSPKISKITSSSSIGLKNIEVHQENIRLAKDNAVLKEKNRELQEKLDMLSKILKDPRKRELLHARLQQLHRVDAKC